MKSNLDFAEIFKLEPAQKRELADSLSQCELDKFLDDCKNHQKQLNIIKVIGKK